MESYLFNRWADIAQESGFPLIRAGTHFYVKEDASEIAFRMRT